MTNFDDYTDEQIAALVQAGNKDAFGIILDRYTDKITRYARRFFSNTNDITDLVQDVFIKSYVNIQSFDTTKKFNPWIYRIAHNEFVNKIAWKSIRKIVSIDADEILPHFIVSEERTERLSLDNEQKKHMEASLSKLDDKYKTPIILFFYEDMSYEEISDVLKIPTSTVGVRIKRGKDKLKEIISAQGK